METILSMILGYLICWWMTDRRTKKQRQIDLDQYNKEAEAIEDKSSYLV